MMFTVLSYIMLENSCLSSNPTLL